MVNDILIIVNQIARMMRAVDGRRWRDIEPSLRGARVPVDGAVRRPLPPAIGSSRSIDGARGASPATPAAKIGRGWRRIALPLPALPLPALPLSPVVIISHAIR